MKLSPEVARSSALSAINARRECTEACNSVIAMTVPSLRCEKNVMTECGPLRFTGGDSLPYCPACGWTLS